MKKIKLFVLLFLMGSSGMAIAQWDTITQFNRTIDDLETFNNDLFMAGNFTKNEGSTCYWSAYYNANNNTTTPHTNMVGGVGIRALEVFGSDLYSADALFYGGYTGVGMWDGSTWVDGGGSNYSHSVIYADGNDLYVVSNDGKIRKKTGAGSFQLFHDFAGNGGVGGIMRYGNKLIFSGSFTSVNGVNAKNIVQWDGTNWQPLGSGLSNGVGTMEVYNNELYVAGSITNAGGVAVTNIAKWNGSAWSAVGGGVTGNSQNGIRDMKAIGTGLLVVGDFTQMGGVTTSNVALWNGTQWTGLGLTHTDSYVNRVEVYNNKIYVGTSDANHSHLYRYMGTVGLGDNNVQENTAVYPNPVKDQLTVELGAMGRETELSIYNMTGQELIGKRLTGTREQVDVSSLPQGVYFLSLQTAYDRAVVKIVKE